MTLDSGSTGDTKHTSLKKRVATMPEYHCQQITYVHGINLPVRIRVEVTSREVIPERVKQGLIRVLDSACDGIREAQEQGKLTGGDSAHNAT